MKTPTEIYEFVAATAGDTSLKRYVTKEHVQAMEEIEGIQALDSLDTAETRIEQMMQVSFSSAPSRTATQLLWLWSMATGRSGKHPYAMAHNLTGSRESAMALLKFLGLPQETETGR